MARRHAFPYAPAIAIGDIGVPLRDLDAKARLQPAKHRLGQSDFRQQDQHLRGWIGAQDIGNGFEIDFGLAGAGNTIEQDRCEGVLVLLHLQKLMRRRL